jgi:hypothetical protein
MRRLVLLMYDSPRKDALLLPPGAWDGLVEGLEKEGVEAPVITGINLDADGEVWTEQKFEQICKDMGASMWSNTAEGVAWDNIMALQVALNEDESLTDEEKMHVLTTQIWPREFALSNPLPPDGSSNTS